MSRRAKGLERINLLELAPVRVASWQEVEERVVIERPKPAGLRPIRDWLRYWLAVRRLRLDERGSFVWRQLDGTWSVGEVAEALRGQFGESVEPAEERAGQLVRMLHSEGLVIYPGWDQMVASEDGREC